MNSTFAYQQRIREKMKARGISPTVSGMDLKTQRVNTFELANKMEELKKLRQNKKKCDDILQYFKSVSRVVDPYDETNDSNGSIAKRKLETLKRQMHMIKTISGGKKKRKTKRKKTKRRKRKRKTKRRK